MVMTNDRGIEARNVEILPLRMISSPSPLPDKKNSAATMPTRPRPIAWRMPVITNGKV